MDEEVKRLREEFPPGTRVRFGGFGVPDPYSDRQPGCEGTVAGVDDVGTVHVDWDDGGHLGCVLAPALMGDAHEPPDRLTVIR